MAVMHEFAHAPWHQAHAVLVGLDLLRHADEHEILLSYGRIGL